jgi:hypothetical protein
LGKGDVASNKRHSHFVSILESICEAFEPKVTEQPASPVAHEKNGDAQAWPNRFAALTVEELEELDDEPDSIASAGELIRVEVDEDKDEIEGKSDKYLSHAFFMFFCLFDDLANFRASYLP